jgi:DNA modification methylase
MLYHGDCREVMATLDADSIDAIVTDPPYGLHFMGKKWDSFGGPLGVDHQTTSKRGGAMHAGLYDHRQNHEFQAFFLSCAEEMIRVLKPGGHLLAFGGTRTFHRLTCAVEDAGFEIRDCLSWLYGSGFPKSHNLPGGLGTALKPGWEPIILARKPLVGTVARNVEHHGTGALNIDGCRIEGVPPSVPQPSLNSPTGAVYGFRTGEGRNGVMSEATGRWPANVVLDEEAAGLLGGPSRFFYCAKASRSERNAGLAGMPTRSVGSLNMRTDAHAHATGNETDPAKNHHPTVKPVALMRWLVRLITPLGGMVLDPFMGSGTTGIACVLEGMAFTGIEQDAEYLEIARRRIAHAEFPLFAVHSES